nr:dolichyl-diphosphooligosaccharide--protein glycosyltransferase subunit 2-like [Ipomoea batatas]
MTRKDQLKVHVNTVLGSSAPPLSVRLKQVFVSGSKDASIVDQDLKFDPENKRWKKQIPHICHRSCHS